MKHLMTMLTAMLLLCCTTMSAHNFEVDGIYYNITGAKTAEVTYKGKYSLNYSNEYSGNVTIPASVTYNGTTYSVTNIGEEAFSSCSSLTSIEIPNSVTTIGYRAFRDCSLTSIEIPNSVTTIGNYAFTHCYSLTSITISNSVTTIGTDAFEGCSSLTSIMVDNKNPIYDSRDNCNALIETASNTLVLGCKNTVIPNSVTTIGTDAFQNCSSLTSITIPNSVTTIEYGAFEYCSSLTSITIPNSVTTIGNSAFIDCRSLTSIEIPNSVTIIASQTFYGCHSLRRIEIPNSITTIETWAFNSCSSLSSIEIPSNVTTIEAGVFVNCHGLTNITVDENNLAYDSRNNCNAIIETASNTLVSGCQSTIIPNSVTTIGESAFGGCSSLTSIEIPNSVTTIGSLAFGGCSSLGSITIPNSVTTIGNYAFSSCSSLTSITSLIPADKLFAPGNYAFYGIDKNNCTLYVPYGAKETYAATEGWNEFPNIVELQKESFDLTVSAAKYATLYLDYNAIIPQGIEVYTASAVDGNYLMMQEVTDILPANTGVIVKAEQGTYTFVESIETVDAISDNLFRGSVEDEYITPAKGTKYYVLSMKDGVVGMYEDALTGGTFKNNAHKAYLALQEKGFGIYDEEVDTEDPGMQLSNKYYFDFSGTTAIDPVVTEVNDNIYYDLSGRRVENPTRGIYIVNGQKAVIK